MSNRCVSLTVKGKVQGVGFRAWTQTIAQRLGLVGHVKNQSDGSVFALAQGDDRAISEFLLLVERGPASAEVENLILQEESVRFGLSGFVIER